jgi:hypothetical protein
VQYRSGEHVEPGTKKREGFKAWAASFIAWVSFSLIGVLIASMAAAVVAYLN